MAGNQMGSSTGGFFPKKPGFASKVGGAGSFKARAGGGGMGKKAPRSKAMSSPGFIKGPRQVKGSKGDGMNGGM
jgi:hypothetical protein